MSQNIQDFTKLDIVAIIVILFLIVSLWVLGCWKFIEIIF